MKRSADATKKSSKGPADGSARLEKLATSGAEGFPGAKLLEGKLGEIGGSSKVAGAAGKIGRIARNLDKNLESVSFDTSKLSEVIENLDLGDTEKEALEQARALKSNKVARIAAVAAYGGVVPAARMIHENKSELMKQAGIDGKSAFKSGLKNLSLSVEDPRKLLVSSVIKSQKKSRLAWGSTREDEEEDVNREPRKKYAALACNKVQEALQRITDNALEKREEVTSGEAKDKTFSSRAASRHGANVAKPKVSSVSNFRPGMPEESLSKVT